MKKVFGYIFLVIGIFLSFSFALYMLTKIPQIKQLIQDNTSYSAGYLFGMLFFDLVFIAIILLMIRTGMRWTRKKRPDPVLHDVLDRNLFDQQGK
ncbi:MAG TPA: hypothetical protein VGD65_24305 [Chryseosolibacter sp.]